MTDDRIYQSDFTGSEIDLRLKAVYPIGSLYLSINSSNPHDVLGFGTWERIENAFLYAASDSDTIFASNGLLKKEGSENVSLKKENIPEHTHTITVKKRSASIDSASQVNDFVNVTQSDGTTTDYTTSSYGQGVNQGNAFSIMPPHVKIYMWYRKE